MNCSECDVYVSALYDGEPIPPEAAQHIAQCGSCRRTFSDYSLMSAELRLAATVASAPLPLLELPPVKHNRAQFLWRRVSVPRFALAALIACLIVATAATSLMRAQPQRRWFQFGFMMQPVGEPFSYTVAKNGYDDTHAMLQSVNGEPVAIALRLKVEEISSDDVLLRCRAVPARVKATAAGVTLLGGPEGGISLNGVADVHYRPGESLAIPIEGGGTLFLKGEVTDHQPNIAFGSPLEPLRGKLVVRSPVLTAGNELIGQMSASASADDQAEKAQGVMFNTDAHGVFTFSLRPFPGAVQGKATWGEIKFRLDGKDYSLMAAAPITGGDQPRPVWVRHDSQSDWAAGCGTICLGAGQLPQ